MDKIILLKNFSKDQFEYIQKESSFNIKAICDNEIKLEDAILQEEIDYNKLQEDKIKLVLFQGYIKEEMMNFASIIEKIIKDEDLDTLTFIPLNPYIMDKNIIQLSTNMNLMKNRMILFRNFNKELIENIIKEIPNFEMAYLEDKDLNSLLKNILLKEKEKEIRDCLIENEEYKHCLFNGFDNAEISKIIRLVRKQFQKEESEKIIFFKTTLISLDKTLDFLLKDTKEDHNYMKNKYQ